jgi:hypothetical protein
VGVEAVRKPLTRAEIAELAASVKALLEDQDAGLTQTVRSRWEGGLAALEAVLGLRTSLLDHDPELL